MPRLKRRIKPAIAIVVLAALLVTTVCLLFGAPARLASTHLTVITAHPVAYDFASALTNGIADTEAHLLLAASSEDFEPTPEQLISIQHSSLLLYTGDESDEWVSQVFTHLGQPGPRLLALPDLADLHNYRPAASAISQALCDLDPTHCSTYTANANNYLVTLQEALRP